jgi:hypothetical protein
MSKLEKVLESIANGASVVHSCFELDLESTRRLMAACSAMSSKVTKLILGSCCFCAETMEVFASSLRSNCVLVEINLSGNSIGAQGALALAEMLHKNTTLKFLFLYWCNVQDKGACHLAVALGRNRTLEELSLGGNGITYAGAAALAAALPLNQKLKCVELCNNPLCDDGVDALAKAVPRSGLRKLWLRKAQFAERGCAALVEMLKNGSQLRELVTDSNHWLDLEEGFRCNGWLLENAPEQYLERNKSMHEQARKAVYALLLIRKLRRTALSLFPKEVVREIAQFMYSSRGEVSLWQANKARTTKRRK